MKLTILFTIVAAILLLAYLFKPLLLGLFAAALLRYSSFRHRKYKFLANIAQGTHEGGLVTKNAGALFVAPSARYCFVKRGTDSTQVIPCAATTDQPIGIAYDVPDAVLDPINVAFLGGACSSTLWVQSAATYAAVMGDYVQTDGNGNAILWATGGYACGRVVNDAPAGDVVEISPMLSTVAHT